MRTLTEVVSDLFQSASLRGKELAPAVSIGASVDLGSVEPLINAIHEGMAHRMEIVVDRGARTVIDYDFLTLCANGPPGCVWLSVADRPQGLLVISQAADTPGGSLTCSTVPSGRPEDLAAMLPRFDEIGPPCRGSILALERDRSWQRVVSLWAALRERDGEVALIFGTEGFPSACP